MKAGILEIDYLYPCHSTALNFGLKLHLPQPDRPLYLETVQREISKQHCFSFGTAVRTEIQNGWGREGAFAPSADELMQMGSDQIFHLFK
ncbi:MAG TPA: hypothetical protein VFI43_06380 [Nitrosospira sp.]|nr:hypothetical protein [Nitrosospira sp.]